MRKNHHIYRSWIQIGIVFAFILVPFLAMLAFSAIADIALSDLFSDITSSIVRIFIAYVIAALLAWGCAVSFYRGKISSVALPIFDILQSIPSFAALPIAILYWGESNFTVIVFLVLAIIWPIFFSTVSSLRLIKHDWEETIQIAGLKGFKKFIHFLLPASIPGLITGSIVGLGEGWEAIVATEIIVHLHSGVGNFFLRFSQDTTITVLGMLTLLIIIFSINKLIWLPLLEWSHRRLEE